MAKRRGKVVRASALCAFLLVCAGANDWSPPPAQLPTGDQARVLITATPLPNPLGVVSVHTAFVVREAGPDAKWERFEVWQSQEKAKQRWGYVHKDMWKPLGLMNMGGGPTRVVAAFEGDEAAAFIPRLRAESPRYENREVYLAYPGPNSNTYVNTMLRRCGLAAELPATAIGKDFRGLLGASRTSGGTGVQVESPLFGVSVGLKEGTSVRALSASIGLDLWPPALVIPVGDGRLGFDDVQ